MKRNHEIIELFNYVRTHTDEETCRHFGGTKMYVPLVVPDIEERVREQFKGNNYRALASRYSVTESYIRKITKTN